MHQGTAASEAVAYGDVFPDYVLARRVMATGVPCSKCGASPGEPCQGQRGARRTPHSERIAAAVAEQQPALFSVGGFGGYVSATNNPSSSEPEKNNSLQGSNEEDIQHLFRFWQQVTGKTGTSLTPQRRTKLAARLEKYTVEEIEMAIVHCHASDFHRQGNYLDLLLICRSDEKLEWFRDLDPVARNGGRRNGNAVAAARADAIRSLKEQHDDPTFRWVVEVTELAAKASAPHEERDAMGLFGNDPAKARRRLAELGLDVERVLSGWRAFVAQYGRYEQPYEARLRFVQETTGRSQ